ncbi:MAG TPA: hypothetical protein VM580_27675 [Labilithrix sp.]|nr:hypothetical protein [Labilithrix sp.]
MSVSRTVPVLFMAALVCAGCEDKPAPPPDPGATPPSATGLAALGIDASVLGDPIDPPAPAGDLKAELERFVNVDQCVAERAKLDPLVGDALGAIGYETFLRDACRLLEAAKDRKRETCDKIDSSALRARCQSWVAMVSQTPDGCPMRFEGLVTRGRDASCVAISARDPRLCAGESRTIARGTCEAMVLRDPSKCETLMPNHRALCQREVARWAGVLMPPLEGLEKLPIARGKLSIHGASGTPDPPVPEVDLSADFVRGVVAVTSHGRIRVELGTVTESEGARIAASPQKKARVGLAMVIDAAAADVGAKQARRPELANKDISQGVLQKLEIELPGEAPLVSPPATCDCKITTARAASTRGGEAAIVLSGTVSGGNRTYTVSIDVATFVRDVLPEHAGTRVLPPIHPVLSGLRGRDGG